LKTFLLLLCVTLGIIFPQAHILSFLIQYSLMLLLIFAFLHLSIDKSLIKKEHFYILAANFIIPACFYFILKGYNSNLALAALITGLSPTAVSAPAVIHQLKGKVEFTAFSVLLTNFSNALAMPFILPLVIDSHVEMPIISVLLPVIIVFSVPLIFVQVVKRYFKSIFSWLDRNRDIPYYILLANIFLATSKATHFIREEYTGSKDIVYLIALLSLVICAVSFFTGSRIGGKEYRQETMQSLGQKNNALSVWLALTFINPLTALGPVFYILYHNIFISFQLYRRGKALKS
jgi:bile acid:Na+ symporter, BASS family